MLGNGRYRPLVAYDEALAQRVRVRLAAMPGMADKRMFGGLAFLSEGRLTVCVTGDDLLVRVGRDAAAEALTRPGARVADMGGRTMAGWVVVDGAALDDAALDGWLDRSREFVRTLPPK
jgi:TfoX/Sxy family transcriptional regulator of competence genes